MSRWMVNAYEGIVTVGLCIFVLISGLSGGFIVMVLTRSEQNGLIGFVIFSFLGFFLGSLLFGGGIILGEIYKSIRRIERIAEMQSGITASTIETLDTDAQTRYKEATVIVQSGETGSHVSKAACLVCVHHGYQVMPPNYNGFGRVTVSKNGENEKIFQNPETFVSWVISDLIKLDEYYDSL